MASIGSIVNSAWIWILAGIVCCRYQLILILINLTVIVYLQGDSK